MVGSPLLNSGIHRTVAPPVKPPKFPKLTVTTWVYLTQYCPIEVSYSVNMGSKQLITDIPISRWPSPRPGPLPDPLPGPFTGLAPFPTPSPAPSPLPFWGCWKKQHCLKHSSVESHKRNQIWDMEKNKGYLNFGGRRLMEDWYNGVWLYLHNHNFNNLLLYNRKHR